MRVCEHDRVEPKCDVCEERQRGDDYRDCLLDLLRGYDGACTCDGDQSCPWCRARVYLWENGDIERTDAV